MDWNWIHEPTNNKRFQREDKSFHMEAPTRGALGALIKSQRAWPTPLRTTGSDCAPSRGVTGDHLMQCPISSIPFVQNDVWLFLARSAHLPADISNWKRNSKWRKSFLSILRWIRYAQCAFGLPGGSVGKESACSVGDLGLIPGLGRSPGEGNGKPTPVFWPEEFHGLYSPWGRKESDTIEQISLSVCLQLGFPGAQW